MHELGRADPRSVGEERLQASGLVLDLASHGARQRRERLQRDVAVVQAPRAGDEPGDQERRGEGAGGGEHGGGGGVGGGGGGVRGGGGEGGPGRGGGGG